MKFIIKSFKENFYVNLSIIIFFLFFFFYNDYNNIIRYFEGNKYLEHKRIQQNIFTIEPSSKANDFIFETSYVFFKKEVDKYFSNYKVETKFLKNNLD